MPISRRGRAHSVNILLLPIALAIAPWPVVAQSDTSSSALLSPDETRACVCLEDQMTRMRDDASSLEDEYNQLTVRLDQLRASMDVSDQAQVDNFRQLHEYRESVRQQLQAQKRGDLSGLVAQWNANCANRRMLEANIDAARANPQCP